MARAVPDILGWAKHAGVVERLTPAQRQAVLLRYDSAALVPRTYGQIAERLHITKQGAHQLVAAGLRRLQKIRDMEQLERFAAKRERDRVRNLGLSKYADYALRRAGITSVTELASLSDADLIDRVPTMITSTVVDEVRSALSCRGLILRTASLDPQQPIAALPLSRRTHLALRRGSLATVGELLALSEEDVVARCPRFGRARIAELKSKLASHGLSLAASSFAGLGLSPRARSALKRGGFRSVQEVVVASDDELLGRCWGLGKMLLQEVRSKTAAPQ